MFLQSFITIKTLSTLSIWNYTMYNLFYALAI